MTRPLTSANTGLRLWNPAPLPEDGRATVAVTGAGRSGTTMLARVLGALGVGMGDALAPPTAEDIPLRAALKARDMGAFAARVAEMNAMAPLWAFKCPALRGQLDNALPLLRSPRLVAVFRDPMAVAECNMTLPRADPNLSPVTALTNAAATQSKFATALAQVTDRIALPVLVVSYEKALADRPALVTALADFCGLEIDPETATRIAGAEIDTNDPRYGRGGNRG